MEILSSYFSHLLQSVSALIQYHPNLQNTPQSMTSANTYHKQSLSKDLSQTNNIIKIRRINIVKYTKDFQKPILIINDPNSFCKKQGQQRLNYMLKTKKQKMQINKNEKNEVIQQSQSQKVIPRERFNIIRKRYTDIEYLRERKQLLEKTYRYQLKR